MGDTRVPPGDTPLMAGEQEHFLAHMAAMHATRGAPTTGGLLVKIPRGSSCPPPQAAYSRALQAVADDGLRFAGMKKSNTNGMSQPTKAMRVVIVAQFQII